MRGLRFLLLSVLVSAAVLAACASAALADGAGGGADPVSNLPLGALPAACLTAPTGQSCEDWAVAGLDAARGKLGLPAYQLPADFAALSADKQALILTNLDRTQYGLPAIPGITAALDGTAAVGANAGQDPVLHNSLLWGFTANWAAGTGYPNLPVAYDAWMYDDGPGSPNQDCTRLVLTACWGHRHNILWEFVVEPGPTAMGAAAVAGPGGVPNYAMVLARGSSAYQPLYTYTWAQAQADGAGGPPAPATPVTTSAAAPETATATPAAKTPAPSKPGVQIMVVVKGHRASIRFTVTSRKVPRCSLRRTGQPAQKIDCSTRTYGLRPGTYVVNAAWGNVRATTHFAVG